MLGTLACGPCLQVCVPAGGLPHSYGTKGAEATVREALALQFRAGLTGASFVKSENSAGSLCLYR